MAKTKESTIYVCQQCGNDSPQWQGHCNYCGEWNSFVEFKPSSSNLGKESSKYIQNDPEELSNVVIEQSDRLVLTLEEINRVLGGGLVNGSVCLLAGEPGIGKSTLLLQIASSLKKTKGNVLYISGEESAVQIRLRADRIGISGELFYLLIETDIDAIVDNLNSYNPAIVIIDSILTTRVEDIPSWPGSVAQVRESTRRITQWAKATGVPVFIAGHITKGGEVAGPKLLEHMVDVVLYLEGDTAGSFRVIRGTKNRFGSTNEVGIFEMTADGLIEIVDPSSVLLSEYKQGIIGSVIIPTLEGTRPILAEIQSLIHPSMLQTPRRITNGIDFNRVLLLSAVLSQRSSYSISGKDIFVSATGGVKISEPAADLGIALSIVSSLKKIPIKPLTSAIGEIGLGGEVRPVAQIERRVDELSRLGFKNCLLPLASYKKIKMEGSIKLIPVSTLSEGIKFALE